VTAVVSGEQAVVVIAYVVALALVAGLALQRQDVR
jgi:hypothetical protein